MKIVLFEIALYGRDYFWIDLLSFDRIDWASSLLYIERQGYSWRVDVLFWEAIRWHLIQNIINKFR